MPRPWKLYLGKDPRSAICPVCYGDDVRRSRHKNVLEKALFRALSLYPYRCMACYKRYFTIGLIQRESTPQQARPDSAHAH